MLLHIKLRDGFQGDTVTLRVNGETMLHRADVTTDLVISVAAMLQVEVADPRVRLEIAIEAGDHLHQIVHADCTPYVDVRVLQGRLVLVATADETPML